MSYDKKEETPYLYWIKGCKKQAKQAAADRYSLKSNEKTRDLYLTVFKGYEKIK